MAGTGTGCAPRPVVSERADGAIVTTSAAALKPVIALYANRRTRPG